jgi:sorbitol-6-phosphate 2-dehydrogenase
MDISFKGKAVFITGAASGIGLACARAFAESGASVAIADVSEDAGKKAAESLPSKGEGQQHVFVKTDVTDQESVEQAVGTATDELGRIDVLVNNAGIHYPLMLVDPRQPKSRYELDVKRFDMMTAVNQKGAFLVAQAVARGMVRQKSGVIINMASEAGLEGSEGQSCYAGTKAALYAFTRSWAKELGRHGIRVVGVAPGILEPTGLRNDAYEEALAYGRGISVEELRKSYEQVSVPLKRVGRISEVADLVLFLASDKAGYITGTTVNISGGKTRA